jgi:Transposase zinc-ribbon domain
MLMDVHQRGDLRFPKSLTEFQRLFPDDAACAGYLEKARWSGGFVCPHCQAAGEPFRFANRPGVLRCRKCRRDTGLTVGTVMARSQHLQAYLNEFTFRFNRRFYPFNAFRSLLGIAGDVTAPTYAELYSGA